MNSHKRGGQHSSSSRQTTWIARKHVHSIGELGGLFNDVLLIGTRYSEELTASIGSSVHGFVDID